MRKQITLLTLLIILGVCTSLYAAPVILPPTGTLLTGTIRYPDGSGLNGWLALTLSGGKSATVLNTCMNPAKVVPISPVVIDIVGGVVQGNQTLVPTHCLSPQVTYEAKLFDNAHGELIFDDQWYVTDNAITGMDLGTMTAVDLIGIPRLAVIVVGAPIVGAPGASQSIVQPPGTTLNVNNLNNVIFVDGVSCSLTDVGAGINCAYAKCPISTSIGGSVCKIVLPPNSLGVCWTLTTPVVLAVSGKLVDVDGSDSCVYDAVVTAHNSFLLDYMPSVGNLSFVPQHGIHNMTLINGGTLAGCPVNGGISSSAVAIANGTTNFGAQLGEFSHLKIECYGTGLANANGNAWGETVSHSVFTHNTIGDQLTAAQEQMKLIDVGFLSNGTDLDVTANAEVSEVDVHHDQATVCSINTHAAVPRITLGNGTRFENLNISGNVCYTTGNNGYYVMKGAHAQDDHGVGASSTAWFTGGFFSGDMGLASGGRLTAPNSVFQVGNQSDITAFIESPGTLDAQHIAFNGAGSCAKVMVAGIGPVWSTCGGSVAVANQTAQAANIGATVAYATSANLASQLLRPSCSVVITQAASVSSTLPNCVVSWTDNDTSVVQTFNLTSTSSANTLGLYGAELTVPPMNVKPGTNVTYSTASYASSGGTPMQYAVRFRLEYLAQ